MTTKRYHGITIDFARDENLSKVGESLVVGYYLKNKEKSPQEAYARTAINFCGGDMKLAQRLYDYVSRGWMSFASPLLSNSVLGTWENGVYMHSDDLRGMPISCFIQHVPDTLIGQIEAAKELSNLSCAGGGVGTYLGMRGITDKSPGAIPYAKTQDSNIMYYHQAGTRRGSVASYLDISHPDIVEFIGVRNPTGGDINRKAHNINIGVNINYAFLEACINDEPWDLIAPNSGEVVETLPSARTLWEEIIETRFKTGEPYIHNVEESNDKMNEALKAMGLEIKSSNICTEIVIPINEERTAVCCLSSPNIEHFELWKDTTMIADIVYMLDNVLTWFIDNAPKELWRAVNSATKSRDIGIGGMGWHYFLMKNNIAFESGGFDSSCQWTSKIFSHMNKQGIAASRQLAVERGEPEDLIGTGMRNATIFAIAPNANSSIIGNTSASIEPIKANAYVHKLRVGSHVVKNPYLQKAFEVHAFANAFTQDWIDAQWLEVIKADGSVKDLDWMPDEQKKVFRTANEIDMMFVIEQARIRQEFICQAQSVNVFFTEGADKRYVNKVHLYAFSKAGSGVPLKSLYYCRATKAAKMEKVDGVIVRESLKDYATQDAEKDECVACSA